MKIGYGFSGIVSGLRVPDLCGFTTPRSSVAAARCTVRQLNGPRSLLRMSALSRTALWLCYFHRLGRRPHPDRTSSSSGLLPILQITIALVGPPRPTEFPPTSLLLVANVYAPRRRPTKSSQISAFHAQRLVNLTPDCIE